MTQQKTCIALITKPDSSEVAVSVAELLDYCIAKNIILATLPKTPGIELKNSKQSKYVHICRSIKEAVSKASVVVTLGGDGTLLSVVRFISTTVPLIGIHYGTLGFLTEHMPSELISVLEDTLNETASLVSRPLLEGRITNDKKQKSVAWSCLAANDIVIQKGGRQKLLEFLVEGSIHKGCFRELYTLRADGIIIATPTGSTAYSLAAGGSVVHPKVGGNLITPLNPHSLTMRPLIVPQEMIIRVRLLTKNEDVVLSIDGQEQVNLEFGSVLEICRSNRTITLVDSKERSYFDVLTRKLHWGKGIVVA